MAEGTEEISVYVDKFRLINEPTNHWEARKKFLMSNWGDYPEMQLVSLSMVWSNMQFDGCKYSPDLMDRVRDMAAGNYTQPSTTTHRYTSQVTPQEPSVLAPSCMIQENQPEEKPLENYATIQGLKSIDNEVASSKTTTETEFQESEEPGLGKNISGAHINITKDTPLISIYPPDGSPNFNKLVKLCNNIKEKAMRGRTDKQIRQMLLTLISFHTDVPSRVEYQRVIEDKKIQSWKAFLMIGKTLCSTFVASAKKTGKEGAIMLLIDLVKEHNVIVLRESCMKEASELGFVYEMVFLNDKPIPQQKFVTSALQDCTLGQDEDLDSFSAGSDIQTDDRKIISAESILELLPRQFVTHQLNCLIIPAPRLPNFVLYESLEDEERRGYNNPVGTIINSCSMCKVPCEFTSERCEIGQGKVGVVCSVFIGHHSIATGLALGNREAKHLAAHNAVKALKLTNPILLKTATADGTSVNRDELTDGPSKEEMLPETNVGHKLLKMMGWKGEGAGLGKKEDGIANPVKATGSGSKSKKGLGCDMMMLKDPTTKRLDDRKVYDYLQDFARSDREDELVFSSELSQDERKKIHNISLKLGLKSKSRGKGDSRYLTVGRKWSVGDLVQAVEEKGGSMGGYELLGPQFLAK